jgi:hypothetical protein
MPNVAFALVVIFGFYIGLQLDSPYNWFLCLGSFGAGWGVKTAVHYGSEAPGIGIARRVVGFCATTALVLLAYIVPAHIAAILSLEAGADTVTAAQVIVASGVAGLALYFIFRRRIRWYVGRLAAPVIGIVRQAQIGKGGSAAFGGLLSEWCSPYRPGGILLGSSLFDPRWLVGQTDDRGVLTIASSRSGKGRSAIIPNLLVWPGSALVIDPKGTNAAVTAARRGHGGGRVTQFLRQDVHIVDPFKIVPGAAGACFNPMAAIDINGPRTTEDIGLIADALSYPGHPMTLTGMKAHARSSAA